MESLFESIQKKINASFNSISSLCKYYFDDINNDDTHIIDESYGDGLNNTLRDFKANSSIYSQGILFQIGSMFNNFSTPEQVDNNGTVHKGLLLFHGLEIGAHGNRNYVIYIINIPVIIDENHFSLSDIVGGLQPSNFIKLNDGSTHTSWNDINTNMTNLLSDLSDGKRQPNNAISFFHYVQIYQLVTANTGEQFHFSLGRAWFPKQILGIPIPFTKVWALHTVLRNYETYNGQAAWQKIYDRSWPPTVWQ